jgi:hypothetical protein
VSPEGSLTHLESLQITFSLRMTSARAVELARASVDRILRRIDVTYLCFSDELNELVNVVAMRNLARAWTLPAVPKGRA